LTLSAKLLRKRVAKAERLMSNTGGAAGAQERDAQTSHPADLNATLREVCILALWETTTIAPGVTRTEMGWGYALKGAKSDLLSSGLAQASWFPNARRDKRGRVIRNLCSEHNGRDIRCTEPSKGCCRIDIFYSSEEQNREKQRKKFRIALETERKSIASLSSSHKNFRSTAILAAKMSLYALHRLTSDGSGGYRYSAQTIDALKCASAELLSILQNGSTLFSQERRQTEMQKIKAETAAADPEFADFMARITKEVDKEAAA